MGRAPTHDRNIPEGLRSNVDWRHRLKALQKMLFGRHLSTKCPIYVRAYITPTRDHRSRWVGRREVALSPTANLKGAANRGLSTRRRRRSTSRRLRVMIGDAAKRPGKLFQLPRPQDFPNLGVRFGAKSEASGAMLPSATTENHTPQGLRSLIVKSTNMILGSRHFLFDGNRK